MAVLWGLGGRRYPIIVAGGTVCVPEVECGRNSIPRFDLGLRKELKSCDHSSGCKGWIAFIDLTLLQVKMVYPVSLMCEICLQWLSDRRSNFYSRHFIQSSTWSQSECQPSPHILVKFLLPFVATSCSVDSSQSRDADSQCLSLCCFPALFVVKKLDGVLQLVVY